MRSLLVVILGTFLWAGEAGNELVPFVIPWQAGVPGAASLTSWNTIPAGSTGWIRAEGAQLRDDRGRMRFLGINTTFADNLPEAAQGMMVANRLAGLGINLVRLHHIDLSPMPNGLTTRDGASLIPPDPAGFDRLHRFLAALKAAGIYADLNLLTGRRFVPADGLPEIVATMEWKDQALLAMWVPEALAAQQAWARTLLGTVNPHTSLTPAQDPATAVVEILNEHGLIHGWLDGTLARLPEPFALALQKRWNGWLAARYPKPADLATAWGGEPPGEDLLNGHNIADFQSGGWWVEQHKGAKFNIAKVPGGVRLGILANGPEGWNLQLGHALGPVQAEQSFVLSLEVKSEGATTLGAGINMIHEPWGPLVNWVQIPLTDIWQRHEIGLRIKANDEGARLCLGELGKQHGTVWIRNVTLAHGSPGVVSAGQDPRKGTVPLPQIANRAALAPVQQADWMRFLRSCEVGYFTAMRDVVVDELGFKGVVINSQGMNLAPSVRTLGDAVGWHAYWQHPSFPNRPWDGSDWNVADGSQTEKPPGILASAALGRDPAKPLLVTEYQHPFPNRQAGEAPLCGAAMAAWQDFDALCMFDLGTIGADHVSSWFATGAHPGKLANLVIAAGLLRRGDLAQAPVQRIVTLSRDGEPNRLALSAHAWKLCDASDLGVPAGDALLYRLGLALGDADVKAPTLTAPINPALVWKPGQLTVVSPKTVLAVGLADGERVVLGKTAVTMARTRLGWSTFAAMTLTGETLWAPGRHLIVATGETANTEQQWGPAGQGHGSALGKGPVLTEALRFRVEIPVPAEKITIRPLDPAGLPGKPLAISGTGARTVAKITAGTLWWEVTIAP